MKILVTGGTGFLGEYFIPKLINQGHEITLLVRNVEKAKAKFGLKCKYWIGDVTDPRSLLGCCNNIDVVFHLVAKSGNELLNKKNLAEFEYINVQGTKNLVSEAKQSKISRFIYISSTAAMGIVKDFPISEKSKCNPKLPYEISKKNVESYLLSEWKENGFPIIILRPSRVYGISEKEYCYLTMAKLVKKGLAFKVGFGENSISNVNVTDLTDGFVNAITKGKLGSIYILTSAESISANTEIKIISEELGVKFKVHSIPYILMLIFAFFEERLLLVLGKKPIVTVRNIKANKQNRIYDISLAEKELDFRPKVSMEQGIREMISWYKQKGLI